MFCDTKEYGDIMTVEDLMDYMNIGRTTAYKLVQSGKIIQRPGQPVQFVNHDEVDFPGRNVRQEPLQRGAVGIPSAEPAVVVMFRQWQTFGK